MYKKIIMATIKDLIVALFIIILVVIVINLFMGQKIENTIMLVNQVAIKVDKQSILSETKLDAENSKLSGIRRRICNY